MILDTNALSAAADNDPGPLAALASAHLVGLPVVVIGEYRAGIAESRHRMQYESWLENLIPDCTILDVTLDTAEHYAAIRLELKKLGKPIPTNDLWIAAAARQHALPILSRDRHFDFVPGLNRVGW